jgi:ABC-type sugar transport system ATPase subunit
MLIGRTARRPFGRRAAPPLAGATPAGGEALRVADVTKWYGSVHALDRVALTVNHGEIVALVGDNGAGKSTLVNIIAGVVQPDEGEFYVEGNRVSIASTDDCCRYGIRTVHQDQTLADNLDVVENLFLGQEMCKGVGPLQRMDYRSMKDRTREVLAELGISTIADINAPVGQMSGGQRQSVAVGRVLLETYPIVLLDEPTTGLGVAECQQVMGLVRHLKARGSATVIVSQNIDEVFEVADRIVVLHLGKVSAAFNRAETTPEEVVGAVMGMAS